MRSGLISSVSFSVAVVHFSLAFVYLPLEIKKKIFSAGSQFRKRDFRTRIYRRRGNQVVSSLPPPPFPLLPVFSHPPPLPFSFLPIFSFPYLFPLPSPYFFLIPTPFSLIPPFCLPLPFLFSSLFLPSHQATHADHCFCSDHGFTSR